MSFPIHIQRKKGVKLQTLASGDRDRSSVTARRAGTVAADAIAAALFASPGQPLEETVRQEMEARLGYDFSQVRVHMDEKAAEAAELLRAEAFTLGRDIFFASGAYQPGSPPGQELLAHELVHTLQQAPPGEGGGQPASHSLEDAALSEPGSPREQEADAAAEGEELADQLSPAPSAGELARRTLQRSPREREQVLWEPAQLLDPALVVERLVEVVIRNLRADPDDVSGRIRRQLEHLAEPARRAVLERAQQRLTQAEWGRLARLVGEEAPPGQEAANPEAPASTDSARVGEGESAGAEQPAERVAEAEGPEQEEERPVEAEPEETRPGREPEEAPAEAREAAGAAEPTPETAPAEVAPTEAAQAEAARTEAGPAVPEVEAQTAEQPAREEGEGGAGPAAEGPAGPPAAGAAGAVPEGAAGGGEAAPVRMPPVLERTPESATTAPTAQAAAPPAETAAARPEGGPSGVEAPVEAEPAAQAQAEAETARVEAENAEQQAAGQPEPGPADTGPAEPEPGPPPGPETAPVSLPVSGELAPFPPGGAPAPGADQAPLAASAAPEMEGEPGAAEAGPEAPGAPAPEEQAEPEAEAGPALEAEGELDAGQASVAGSLSPALAVVPAAPAAAGLTEVAAPESPLPAGPTAGEAQPGEAPAPAAEVQPVGTEMPSEPGAPGAGAEAAVDPACAPGGAPAAAGPEAGGGGGACGGGGGGEGGEAAPAETQAPPDVSQAEPTEAMTTVANLPPAQMESALGGVAASADRSVGAQRQELQESPPQMERPNGMPADRDATQPPPEPAPPSAAGPTQVEAVPAGEPAAAPPPAPLPAEPADATRGVRPPSLPANEQITPQDAQQIQSAVRSLPTRDPALEVTAGDPPSLRLEGDADPQQARQQGEELGRTVGDTHREGQREAAQPLGENDLYPQTPQETLTAQLDGQEGGAAGAPARAEAPAPGPAGGDGRGGGAGGNAETLSVIAQEERGGEIRSAATQARADMQASQQEQAQNSAREQTSKQQEIEGAIQGNGDEQRQERQKAQRDVLEKRTEWRQAQQAEVDRTQGEAGRASQSAEGDISRERDRGERDARGHIQKGNEDIAKARGDAERTAEQQRRRAEQETSSGGFFSWLSSRVTSFFNSIRDAIQSAFEAARRLARAAFELAQRLAGEAIARALRAIADRIASVVQGLIALGTALITAFRSLVDRFRSLIIDLVNRALAAVRALVEQLKQAMQNLLNLLGRALSALLDVLASAYRAAVAAVRRAVQAAIQFARSIAEGFAAFAQLIRDVAADPGGWLRKLGRAVVDGIRNCLWDAFKTAVRNWFDQKVQEVLGLGLMLWNVLVRGCMSIAQIGTMAWEALKAAIPMVLIQLLIEKLVSMIVPAAGAILTIIEGLRAAWGTVSRIITAFRLFFEFLKAVKTGNAAGKFANAVAAAAVVVIDFVANWLLARLRRPASAIGGRLRTIAQRIGQAIGRGARRGMAAIRRGLAAIGRGVRTAGRATAGAARRGVQALARTARRAGTALARTRVGQAAIRAAATARRAMASAGRALARSRVGRAAIRAYQATRRTVQRARASFRRWRERRRQRQLTPQQRLNRAISAIRPRLTGILRRGAGKLTLRARLAFWRVRYRLSALQIQPDGDIYARVNPGEKVLDAKGLDDPQILLASELERIFSSSELTLEEEIRTQPSSVREEYRHGRSQIIEGRPGETGLLYGASRPVQTALFREQIIPPGTHLLEPGVTGRFTGTHLGQVEIRHAGTYPAISGRIGTLSARYGIPDAQIAQILSIPSSVDFHRRLNLLESELQRIPGVGPSIERTRFVNRLSRVGILTQSLEPARRAGIATPTALAYTLAGRGAANFEEIAGREGRYAPMTPVGAASQADTAQRREAERLRLQRIHNIITLVRNEARQNIIVLENGYDVSELRRALNEHISRHLYRDERQLRAQIRIFLRSYFRL